MYSSRSCIISDSAMREDMTLNIKSFMITLKYFLENNLSSVDINAVGGTNTLLYAIFAECITRERQNVRASGGDEEEDEAAAAAAAAADDEILRRLLEQGHGALQFLANKAVAVTPQSMSELNGRLLHRGDELWTNSELEMEKFRARGARVRTAMIELIGDGGGGGGGGGGWRRWRRQWWCWWWVDRLNGFGGDEFGGDESGGAGGGLKSGPMPEYSL